MESNPYEATILEGRQPVKATSRRRVIFGAVCCVGVVLIIVCAIRCAAWFTPPYKYGSAEADIYYFGGPLIEVFGIVVGVHMAIVGFIVWLLSD